MTFRLLGMTDEERLAFEEASGIKTEGARLLVEASVQETQKMLDRTLREVQGVIGPHGSVSRLQAGGVNISRTGVSVYEDGILKTTVDLDGDFLAGSNIESPATTSFCVFVNEQIYNTELMGAGDILIGDNSTGVSNVKYDVSEGQLQFRYGTTVNVYMDTDGSLKAGGGAVVIDADGQEFTQFGDSILFSDDENLEYEIISQTPGAVLTTISKALRLLSYKLSTGANLLTNGDFETGSLTGWTEVDAGGHIAISANGEGYEGGYAVRFQGSVSPTEYIEQSITSTYGVILKLRVRVATGPTQVLAITNISTEILRTFSTNQEWRTFYLVLPGSVTYVRISVDGAADDVFIDDIEALAIAGTGTTSHASMLELAGGTVGVAAHIFELTDITTPSTSLIHIETDGADRRIGLNDNASDTDTIVRGDTDQNLLYVDAGSDRVGIGTNAPNAKLDIRGAVIINEAGGDADVRIEGDTDANLLFTDASTDRVGIGTNTPGYKLDVAGDINISSGSVFRVNGVQVLSGSPPAAETNANDIFRCDSPGGVSAFVGTIATLPGGATLTYNITAGQEAAMVPNTTAQLGKMRLYNTTRGTNALISNCATGTNTLTLTANVPAGWQIGDTITIASQTVSGGGLSWVDVEITSALTGKTDVFINIFIVSGTTGDQFALHPTETFATSKQDAVQKQATGGFANKLCLLKLTSNVFTLSWTGTPTNVIVREAGYLK